MKLAYGKLGRSIPLTMDAASNIGGDAEVIHLLNILRRDHEVHLIGRNRCDAELSGVVNHWAPGGTFDGCPPASRSFEDPVYQEYLKFLGGRVRMLPKFDAWVIWLGQHGSSVHPVPAVQEGKLGTYTNPLASDINYGFPLIHAVNVNDVRPLWLCPDPRNMVKFRDLWDPNQRPILAQFNTRKDNTFFSEKDGKLRTGFTKYVYSGIELLAVPPEHDGLPDLPPLPFGILVNEGRTGQAGNRLDYVKQWLGKLSDWEIFGYWTPASQQELGREIYPVDIAEVPNVLRRWRSTITFPATNSGWATAKPWECFSAGTICFKHPGYDTQGHIYGEHMPDELRRFLKPNHAGELRERIEALTDADTWLKFATLQLQYLKESRIRLQDGAAYLNLQLKAMVMP